MKHLFVPYQLAKLAKEKGFCVYTSKNNHPIAPPENEHCLGWYEIRSEEADKYDIPNWKERDGKFHYSGTPINNANLGSGVVAPLYQQLADWFREKHGLFLCVEGKLGGLGYFCTIYPKTTEAKKLLPSCIETPNKYPFDYYDILTKALEEAFKLIG